MHDQAEWAVTDLLVRLYALEDKAPDIAALAERGIVIRRAVAPERRVAVNWVAQQFGEGWAGEVEAAFSRTPTSCHIAVGGQALLGFACFDATALGFFGPTGVAPSARGQGIGAALLWASLTAMHAAGYAYAIIGGVGPVDFYARVAGAIPIPDSTPGLYGGLLRSPARPRSDDPSREPSA